MRKQSLVDLVEFIKEDLIEEPPAVNSLRDGESLQDRLDKYAKATLKNVRNYLQERSERDGAQELIDIIKSNQEQAAILFTIVRKLLVEKWVKKNDNPFQNDSKTDLELLKENDWPVEDEDDVEKLKSTMKSKYDEIIEGLRTDKDDLDADEVADKWQETFVKYQPVYPSKKTFTNNGQSGSTYGFNFNGKIQEQYPADHERFIEYLFDTDDKVAAPTFEEEGITSFIEDRYKDDDDDADEADSESDNDADEEEGGEE